MKIELPVIFGEKSKIRLITTGGIMFTLTDDYLYSRTTYRYEEPNIEDDEYSEYVEKLCNEKYCLKKTSISRIAIAYDEKDEVYFISMVGNGFNICTNVESAEKANEVYNLLIKWWQE